MARSGCASAQNIDTIYTSYKHTSACTCTDRYIYSTYTPHIYPTTLKYVCEFLYRANPNSCLQWEQRRTPRKWQSQWLEGKDQNCAAIVIKRGSLHVASKTDCRAIHEGVCKGLGGSSCYTYGINTLMHPGRLLNYE